MRGICLLTIWYTIGLAVASNEALLRRTHENWPVSPVSPGSPQAKRQRTKSPSPRTPESTSPSSSGFTMTHSTSSDSLGITSLNTRVTGPGYVNVDKSPSDLKVGPRTQYTQKVWDTGQLTSRASLRTTPSHPQVGAEVVAKGTAVKARLDTTRGGTGYIRTKGRAGYHRKTVEPGRVAVLGATAIDGTRARLKAKLSGGGILQTKTVYRDNSRSASMSTGASSGDSQADAENPSNKPSVSSSRGKSDPSSNGQSKDLPGGRTPRHPGGGNGDSPNNGRSGGSDNGQARGSPGSKPSHGSDDFSDNRGPGDAGEASHSTPPG
ncbi:MAG: hypothetical protein GOMPHAMPRED_005984 [Gomphillus americanus]|uniref:Uncharacterized protein n=1 Tax=Gomphillus americanus TaxID=1940652 RepID=A0A8H3ERW3_9LECA|nr:MAG: hypothetical protein GOMPHAMPRED_005984 [Gomphillus americanus]